MKKKIEGQIKALASKLLLDESRMDVATMKERVGQLYEHLAILEYLESQIEGGAKIEIETESLDSKSYREENWFKEPEPVPQPEHKEDLVEPLMEKIKDIVAQMPEESQQVDELLKEVLPEPKLVKNDLEEFASDYAETPVFERKETGNSNGETAPTVAKVKTVQEEDKPKSLNDALTSGQGMNIGLNDRLAFIKHLFDGKAEDYTRVLNHVTGLATYDDAETYIKGKVKPEYNYWLNKDEFADRFMSIVEKSFS